MNIDDNEIQANLQSLLAEITEQTPASEEAMADVIVLYVKDEVPVVTGQLRDSAHREGSDAVVDAPYAAIVNETPGGRGFGYMERAVDRAQEAALDAAAQRLEGGAHGQ